MDCQRCGKEIPAGQQKEVFVEAAGERVKNTVCPTCLDGILQDAEDVRGVAGEEKRAAVSVTPSETDESFDLEEARRKTQGESGLEQNS